MAGSSRELGEIKATLKYIQEATNRLENKIDEMQEDIRKARELAIVNSNEIALMKRNQKIELTKWAIIIGTATALFTTILAVVLQKVF